MRESRRRFVLTLAAVAGSVGARETLLLAPPERLSGPARAGREAESCRCYSRQHRPSVRKKSAAGNEREFRAGVERLYQLTNELHDEVQKTPTSEILSIRMYKKTEEIERLAKQIKSKAKG